MDVVYTRYSDNSPYGLHVISLHVIHLHGNHMNSYEKNVINFHKKITASLTYNNKFIHNKLTQQYVTCNSVTCNINVWGR